MELAPPGGGLRLQLQLVQCTSWHAVHISSDNTSQQCSRVLQSRVQDERGLPSAPASQTSATTRVAPWGSTSGDRFRRAASPWTTATRPAKPCAAAARLAAAASGAYSSTAVTLSAPLWAASSANFPAPAPMSRTWAGRPAQQQAPCCLQASAAACVSHGDFLAGSCGACMCSDCSVSIPLLHLSHAAG